MKRMKHYFLMVFLIVPALSLAEDRGLRIVPILDQSGNKVGLYRGSHALVIGVSEYTNGWPGLPSVTGETRQVRETLESHGFSVRLVLDPDDEQLERAFKDFIDEYGYDRDNRLIFFFSGHGYSRKKGEKGYLVPTNAPDPRKDEKGFLQKALPMSQITAWCRQMEAKHALFLFDSCFSGTIFQAKALPGVPPYISKVTSLPVRQFVSAGDAGETVPAKSVFTPSFIRGLEGEADLSRDGYITGSELGMYLRDRVTYYGIGQNPQYGKIRDPDLDRGDFVFALQGHPARMEEAPKPIVDLKGDLFIKSTYDGASVYLDGEYRGVTPITLKDIRAGEHLVRVEKDIYAGIVDINIAPDRVEKLDIEMKKRQGKLKVYSDPAEAFVYLDGENVGKSPLILSDITMGTHELRVEKEGLWPHEETIRLSEETISVSASLKNEGRLILETVPGRLPITLDGKYIGHSPVRKMIEAGGHEINLAMEGYITLNERIEVPGGADVELRYELVKKPALSFDVWPKDASVILDNKRVVIDGKDTRILEPGEHTFLVEKQGYMTEKKKFTLKGNDRRDLKVRLKVDRGYVAMVRKARTRNGIISLSSLGVAASAAGGVYYFGNEAERARKDYEGAVAQEDMDRYKDDVRTNNTLNNVAVGIGIAGITSAVVFYLINPEYPKAYTGAYGDSRNRSSDLLKINTSEDVFLRSKCSSKCRNRSSDLLYSDMLQFSILPYGERMHVSVGFRF